MYGSQPSENPTTRTNKFISDASVAFGFGLLLLVTSLVFAEGIYSAPKRTTFFDLSRDPKEIADLPKAIQESVRPILNGHPIAVVVVMPDCQSCSAKNIPNILRVWKSEFGDSVAFAWLPESKPKLANSIEYRHLNVTIRDLESIHIPFQPRAYGIHSNGQVICQEPSQSLNEFKRSLQ